MQIAACRFCYANNPCVECLNLEYNSLASPPLSRPVWFGSGSGREARRTFNHRIFNQNSTSCRYCALLRDSVEAVDEFQEGVVALYRWEVGQTLRIRQIRFSAEFDLHPQLELYTTSGGAVIPTAIGRGRSVPDFWSDESREALLRWLETDQPPSPAPLPKRVLDVGQLVWSRNPAELTRDVKLWETGLQRGHYVTLSHCWVGRHVLTTTSATLSDRLGNITFGSLSPLFRDAVRVCRFLGIRYLWIDALCILQGNQADWEEEAAEMSNIYENASFTIAVQHDTEDGFIPHPAPHQVRPETQLEPAIFVRKIERPGFLNPNGVFFDTPHANPSVIHARAWCYQERMLSSRMLHFMSDEVIFESGDSIECQCGNHFGISTDRVMRAGNTALDWKNIVSRFSQLALTHKWDLLPGVAGIARRYQDVYQPGDYIAGLWQGDLIRWLCWKSVPWHTGRNMRLMCMDCAPLPNRLPPPPSPHYTVPSFSWASRFGPCEFIRSVWNAAEGYKQTAAVENVQYEPDSRNPFGRVIRCSIRLRGHIEEYYVYSTLGKARIIPGHDRDFAYLCGSATHNEIRARLAAQHPPTDEEWFPLVKEEGTCFWIDAGDDIPPDGAKILAIQLFERISGSIGLVLQERVSASESPTGENRRIGLCFFDRTVTARIDGSITIT